MVDSEGGLCPNIFFDDPLECIAFSSGMDVDYISHVTKNCNEYFHTHFKPMLGQNLIFHRIKWVNIVICDMFIFLAILLKISLQLMAFGGYPIYFQKQDIQLCTTTDAKGKFI